MTQLMDPAGLKPINLCTAYQPQTSTLLVGRCIILYSQRTIKVLIKLSGMICTFIVGISQKRESVILILILFGTYDMYIMVYKSSNYKQWPGIVFWYSQIQNPVQTKIKTLKYFNYITLSSTDLFFLQLFDYIYVCLYIWKQSTRQALLLKRKIYCSLIAMTTLIVHWLTMVQLNNSIHFCLILNILIELFSEMFVE